MKTWQVWLHGLVAATVSGTAGGIGTVVGSLAVGDNLLHGLKVAGVGAIFSGIIGAAAYLKQSPVPPGWDGAERRSRNGNGSGTADRTT